MRFAQYLLASFAVVLVFCLPSSAGAAAGRTPGAATVTSSGSSSYSIPIAVPPGVNGMTPSLGLSYSSRTDNGVMGVGWSIDGMSAVVRCPRTWAQDGEARDVRLDSSDRFCLDGSKLRLVSGVYGVAGANYRTEIETFSRITSAGTPAYGPERFTVEGKDGLFYYYGHTDDSRIEALGQDKARAWALSKIRDRAGNYIAFTYVEDTTNGSFRIASVAYGGNEVQQTPASHSVSFVYETKPSNEIDSGYIAGSLVKEITRLDRVDVLYGSTVVRRYELTYEGALSSTSKSRLASVQECAGSPLDCFPATTFSYQNGTSGLAASINTGVSVPTAPWALDVNGDGRTDLVYSSSATSGSGVWMVMLANLSGGYNSPINTGVINTNYAGAIPIDYNADGSEDLLVPYSGGTWWYLRGNHQTGLAAPVNTGAPATGTGNNARAMDVNGDGLEDLVWADLVPAWTGGDAIRYRLREWGGTFSTAVTTLVGPTPVDSMIEPNVFALDSRASRRRTQDFNGDGRADIIFRHSSRIWEAEQQRWIQIPTVSVHCVGGAWNINAEDMTGSNTLFFGDFNADGKTDVLFRTISATINTVRLSTGKTLKAGFNLLIPAGTIVQAILDWDGDGYDDALARNTSNGTWYVLRSTGESFTTAAATGLSAGTAAYTVMDVNGDGLPDLGNTVGGVWDYRLHAGVAPDLLQTATDGFGNYTTFNYAPLLNPIYSKHGDASYPSQDYQGSLSVVTGVTASDGIGGSYTMSYRYAGARINLQGRGFEGFASRISQDSRDSTSTEEIFHRTFPYTGRLASIEFFQPDGTTPITRVQHSWSAHAYGSGAEAASLPFISQSATQKYAVGSFTYNGDLISSSITTNLVDAASGTLYDTTIRTTEAASANGVQPGATYTQRMHLPTANFASGNFTWCIGRPGRIEYTNSQDQYGGGQITRTVELTWDTASCRVTQQVQEPGSAQWRVTTDIGYDSFGNVNTETVTGVGMPPRTTTANFGATGRFLQSGTNALSQTTQFSWNAGTGTLASVIDPNGLGMSWQYDGFGRRTRETRSDDSFSIWQFNNCTPVTCPASNMKTLVLESLYDTNGDHVTSRDLFTDRFDRPVAAKEFTISGFRNRIQREYDALGRVARQGAPCWDHNCAEYWTTFTYDVLGRVTQVQRPTSDSNPTLQSTLTYYEGLTTRSVDALSKQSTHVSNALGRLARSIDHDGHYQSFDYDAFGNAVRVTDSASNVLMSNVFNVRGMRTSQTDMDMGTWTYTPNALGEVISQTDAKNQTTSYGYDLLGRLTTRTELEGVSTFTFGTSAAAHNIGQLVSMSGPGYSESFTYDSVGRVSQRTITSDATYQFDYAYNALGALHTLTYPTSTSGYRLKLEYLYSIDGVMRHVRDFNAPSTVFWHANDSDPRGAVIHETLGNGVQTIRGFDAVTGVLDYIQSGPGGGSALQNDSYQWDQAGNLTQRSEANIAMTQDFAYDNLHRLDHWTANGGSMIDLTYDALGNITSRTFVGTYTYDATRKHRLLSAGSNSFSYDNNGNVTAKNGRPITWYSYNLPKLITNSGNNSSEFFYAPDRSRWKQVASYGGTAENTIYIGGLVEKVTLGSVTSWKHYISGTTGVVAEVIRRSNGTNETVYLLKDHLGSTEVVTNASGGLLARLAYGGQGGRRNGTTWGGIPSSSEWATITNTTRRGFTSHEMLDNLGLVHMNGRVYDHDVGRFLSADPLVQDPAFTQSFNRYSYAWNNPLTYSDPSGYSNSYGLRFYCEYACVAGGRGGYGSGADSGPSFSVSYGPMFWGYNGSYRNADDGPSVGGGASQGGMTHVTPAFTPSTVNGHTADTVSTVADVLVPGKYYVDHAQAAWQEGQYVYGALNYGAAWLDVGMGVVTAGQSTRAVSAVRSAMWGARAALLARRSGGGGHAIALGLEESANHKFGVLHRFADKVGAHGWWDWHKLGLTDVDLWQHLPNHALFREVFESVAPKASSIKFNLSMMRIEGLATAPIQWKSGHITAAELMTVVSDPMLLRKTTFYREGQIVPTEQVLREIGFVVK